MSQQYPPDQGHPPYPSYQQPQQPSYPQLPAQPPFYPPVQQPPKKRGFLRSPLGIGCGVVAILVVLIIVIVAIASAASGGNTSNPSSSNTTGSTPASSQSSQSTSIGKPVQAGDWQVTLNKLSTSTGSEFDTPKSGDIFLVLNVTLKNTSSTAQTASSFITFALKDSTGQTYQEDITSSGTPDGNVAAGGIVRGNITYAVPKSVHSFTLQFTPGLDASQLVEWQIKE